MITKPPLIRIIPHEESIELRISTFFYFDDIEGRRSINGRMTRSEAEAAAKALARAERDKGS